MNILQNPVTALVCAIVAIAAIAGAVVVIIHPETLTFSAYLDDLEKFVVGAGLLGIGRGIKAAGEQHAVGQRLGSLRGDVTDTHTHD